MNVLTLNTFLRTDTVAYNALLSDPNLGVDPVILEHQPEHGGAQFVVDGGQAHGDLLVLETLLLPGPALPAPLHLAARQPAALGKLKGRGNENSSFIGNIFFHEKKIERKRITIVTGKKRL